MAGLNIYGLQAYMQELDNERKNNESLENKNLNLEEIKADRYISDNKENTYTIIENILMEKRKTLIIAPMKCGKSTFSFKELYPVLTGCNYHFIFVSPKTSLLEQIENEYRVNSCYGGAGATISELPIVTTPDSLYKVTKALEEDGKPFIICYDEIHEAELNYKHRHKLVRPFNEFENPLCMGLIGLTATADNVIKSMKWDKIYRVKPQQMFQQTPYTNIITGLGNNIEDIATHVVKTIKANADTPLVIRVNDKKKIEAVKDILTGIGITGVNCWFRSNKSEEDNSLLSEMLDRIHCDFNVLLTTSLVDVGVELFPMRKPIVIDFMDYNSRIIENIQFIGRFREGVAGYHLVMPISEYDVEEKFLTYEEVREDITTGMKTQCWIHNDMWTKHKKEFDGLHIEYDQLNEEYTYSLDEWGINATVFETYIKQIVKDKDKLKEFLEMHFTFNSAIIKTIHFSEDYTNMEEVKAMCEDVKEVNKAKRLEFKEQKEEFEEWVKDIDDLTLEVLITKPDDITINNKWVMEEIEEHYSFYWSDDMSKHRKHFYSLLDYEKDGYSKKELLIRAINTKWYNDYKKRCRYAEANKMFDGKQKALQLDAQLRKTKVIVYTIRQTINKLKGSEIGVALSNKFINELHELCTTKKCFKDTSLKAFTSQLDLIYNVSNGRCRTITSVKSKVIFE